MSVSVVEIVRAVQLNAVSLTAESSGYLLLAIIDAGGLAGPVPADQMILLENGEFRLGAVARRDSSAAASDLRALLGRLMALCSATHPPLAAVSCAEGSDFAQSLLAALIPVNRAAAKRTLARTCRETDRAVRAGKLTDLGPAWQWLQGPSAQKSNPTPHVEKPAPAPA
ncbi:MAG TPA: hypothetical protein VL137_04130, partial [Polyangiaceae bacterium]|nr:hypothetical protein [Polyangiaceae bacterium]